MFLQRKVKATVDYLLSGDVFTVHKLTDHGFKISYFSKLLKYFYCHDIIQVPQKYTLNEAA